MASKQLNVRISEEQETALAEIAHEQGLFGGPGKRPDEPNLSAALRYLAGRADRRMAKGPDMNWDRRPR